VCFEFGHLLPMSTSDETLFCGGEIYSRIYILARCFSRTMTTTNLVKLVLLDVPAAMSRQDPKMAHAHVISLQRAVKSEDLLVVAREGMEVLSKILRCAGLIWSVPT